MKRQELKALLHGVENAGESSAGKAATANQPTERLRSRNKAFPNRNGDKIDAEILVSIVGKRERPLNVRACRPR